ncbi:hypothetical protein CECT5772_10682 [Streptococcus equi subsp. ruminatorum CECT 5772]|uniref:Uncharacterized protein n=1 Tax=Streptococcus equi subsp. ruminatorum CECT 5772 TaxID=1051981 RepID=A0A922NSI1_9STRE|nr:hypothetical protein CECT5772_10682 [Streptococcus equi subsp. ruminatorum CECT 5772]
MCLLSNDLQNEKAVKLMLGRFLPERAQFITMYLADLISIQHSELG